MAKHNSRKRRDNMESVKIIALVVFILIGLGVIAGSIWYYLSFKPRAAADISAVAKSFTLDYFNVSYEDITGTEGKPWMTEAFAQRAASGQRVAAWQESELVSRVKGDVEITIHRQGLRAATVQGLLSGNMKRPRMRKARNTWSTIITTWFASTAFGSSTISALLPARGWKSCGVGAASTTSTTIPRPAMRMKKMRTGKNPKKKNNKRAGITPALFPWPFAPAPNSAWAPAFVFQFPPG